ncbi:MAG: phosphate ABC transporter substrate-binding protein PstS [Chthonomonadales bacterium]
MSSKFSVIIAAAAVAFSTLVGRNAGAQTINGAGATFPAPIYTKWFQAYSQAHPNVKFNYQPVGSGAGIAQYKAGTVFFGATDAPVPDADLASMQPTIHIPTVAGSVVMAYNIKGIGSGLKLSGDVIADIYLGKISTWNDVRIVKENPNLPLPAEAITVVHRSDGSGTTYIYTNYLAAVSSEWKNKVGAGKSVSWPTGLGGNGNAGVAGLVRSSAGGIGYVELAYAVQTKLNYGPVKNKSGNYVLASSASTTAAASVAANALKKDLRVSIVNGPGANTYPIAGFTYLLIPKNAKDTASAAALADFLKWAMGPGQGMAESLLYAPLPSEAVKINEAAIATIKVK